MPAKDPAWIEANRALFAAAKERGIGSNDELRKVIAAHAPQWAGTSKSDMSPADLAALRVLIESLEDEDIASALMGGEA